LGEFAALTAIVQNKAGRREMARLLSLQATRTVAASLVVLSRPFVVETKTAGEDVFFAVSGFFIWWLQLTARSDRYNLHDQHSGPPADFTLLARPLR
jgi:peptidoglycan/LPS O-acetylase OafA/YrhL